MNGIRLLRKNSDTLLLRIHSVISALNIDSLRPIALSGEYIDAPCVGCDTGHPIFTRDLELTGSLDSFFEMSINAR